MPARPSRQRLTAAALPMGLAAAAALALAEPIRAAPAGHAAAVSSTPARSGAGGGNGFAAEHARLDTIGTVYAGYYAQPPEVPARLLRIGVSADDVSVVLWLARTGAADPNAIASARMRGGSWAELLRTYRVPLRALVVRLDAPPRGPYARPYRVLRGRTKGPLTDAEVRDLVQLRLLTEYFRLRPSRVAAGRAAGRSSTDLILAAYRDSDGRPPGRPLGRRP